MILGRKSMERFRRILCAGVLPLAMVMSMTSYAAEEMPGSGGTPAEEQTLSANQLQTAPEEQVGDEVQTYHLQRTKEKKAAPEVSAQKEDWSYQILEILGEPDYVSGITELSVDGNTWEAMSSKYSVYYSGQYYKDTDNNKLYFYGYPVPLTDGQTIVIKHPEYEDLTLTVVKADDSTLKVQKPEGSNPDPGEIAPPSEEKKAPPSVSARKSTGWDQYQILEILGDTEYASGIQEVRINDVPWTKTDYKIALSKDYKNYFVDSSENLLYFDGLSEGALAKGDQIVIKNEAYQDLILSVTEAGSNAFAVAPYDENDPVTQDALHIRLVGYFEAALKGQKEYDAISGASNSITTNQNSNVTVQAAVLSEGQEPIEEDWKVLDTQSGLSIHSDRSKTYVTISPEGSGMIGVYSPYDGSLTLAGTPETPGEYQIQVTYTDSLDRTAVSNELPFEIYEGSEKLCDRLKLENATQTEDRKYMYDMEPWAIKEFGGEQETVTVPAEIKAWYGSHTSGTYGELGYALNGEPVQTLVIPSGCNLTMVNMKVLSSVRIQVQDGGKLVLRDSSVYGKIEVEHGGRFSMNYDDYNKTFLSGAMINGQLICKDGAVLEHASIYSNTNFLTDGSEAKHNVEPVVLIQGTVTVNGQVFIRGDEAASGTDPSTQKSYAGQTALKIENGTLQITEGSVVAAYGGGHLATTSVGGKAVVLQQGAVTGEGRLIAVGGNGTFGDGGNAVSGEGNLSVRWVYLEGGSTSFPKDESVTAGASIEDTVTIAPSTNQKQIEGKRITSNSEALPDTYWIGTEIPDLSLYQIESNAPGDKEDDKKPGESEGDNTGDDKNPGETEGDNTGDDKNPGETGGDNTGDDKNLGETGGDNTGDDKNPEETGGDNTGDDKNPGETGGDNTGDNKNQGVTEGSNTGSNQNPSGTKDDTPSNNENNSQNTGESKDDTTNSNKPKPDESKENLAGTDDQNSGNYGEDGTQGTNSQTAKRSRKSRSSRSGSSSETTTAASPLAAVPAPETAASAPAFSQAVLPAQSSLSVSTERTAEDTLEKSTDTQASVQTASSEPTSDIQEEIPEEAQTQPVEDEAVPLSNHQTEKNSSLPWILAVVILLAGSVFLWIKRRSRKDPS